MVVCLEEEMKRLWGERRRDEREVAAAALSLSYVYLPYLRK